VLPLANDRLKILDDRVKTGPTDDGPTRGALG